jgi:protoheme ferro-lyase
VLHNEAAAYQRIWAIEKCSKYIEATIYNIETSLDKDADVYSRVTFTEPSLKGK